MAGNSSAPGVAPEPPEPSTPASKKSTKGRATSARTQEQEVAGQLPVRAGEERWTPAELAEVRSGLESETAELRTEIERTETDLADRMRESGDGAGGDQADAGAKTFEREHELALTHNARELMEQNERAVQRIEAGTYGTCALCGNPIGKARLQAFPRATLCVTCKQREERR